MDEDKSYRDADNGDINNNQVIDLDQDQNNNPDKDKNKRNMLYLIGGLLLVLMIAFNVYAHAKYDVIPDLDPNDQTSIVRSPVFEFKDFNGVSYRITDFYGKPTIVNFWASWCPPCIEEMAAFNKLAGEYGEQINFIMIDCVGLAGETLEMGKNFIASINYSNLSFYYDDNLSAFGKLNFSQIPYTYPITSDGYSLYRHVGMLTEDMLRERIIKLLEYEQKTE